MTDVDAFEPNADAPIISHPKRETAAADDDWSDVRLASEAVAPVPEFVPSGSGKGGSVASLPDRKIFATRHDGSRFRFDGGVTPDILDNLLYWASEKKSSDITIQTNEPVTALIGPSQWCITERILRQPDIDAIVRYVYGDQGPGMLKAGHDLDPPHEVRMDQRGIMRYRVNMTAGRIPGGDGVQIKIRTLPKMPIKLNHLGVEDDIVRNLRPKDGVVFVTGPTGSGKSTLLSSMVREILENPESNASIIEYSKPIEYVFDGVAKPTSTIFQTEVGRHLIPHNSPDTPHFAYAGRNALRRNPDIILIGETRDAETMNATIDLSLTGHLVYSTLHVVGVSATLRRALTFYPPEQRASAGVDVMESLRVVISQILRPALDGGRIGLREYMVFDESTRYQFMKTPPDEWPLLARRMMMEKRVVSKRLVDSAWEAYDKGLVGRDVYKEIVEGERNQQ